MEGCFERALGAHARIAADIHSNSCSLIIRTIVKTLVFALWKHKTPEKCVGLYIISKLIQINYF